jgi:hypothetical protein
MSVFSRSVEAAQTMMLKLLGKPAEIEDNDKYVSGLLIYQAGQYHIFNSPTHSGVSKTVVRLISVVHEGERERIWWVERVAEEGEIIGVGERHMSPHALTEMEVIAWASK